MVNLFQRLLGKKDEVVDVNLETRLPASQPAEGQAVAEFRESIIKKGQVEGAQAPVQRESNLEVASKAGQLGRGRIN